MEPGQIVKLGRSYNESISEKWLQSASALNDTYTVKEEVDEKMHYYFWTITATEDTSRVHHDEFNIKREIFGFPDPFSAAKSIEVVVKAK